MVMRSLWRRFPSFWQLLDSNCPQHFKISFKIFRSFSLRSSRRLKSFCTQWEEAALQFWQDLTIWWDESHLFVSITSHSHNIGIIINIIIWVFGSCTVELVRFIRRARVRAQQLGPFTARNSSTAAAGMSDGGEGSSLDVFSPGFALDDVMTLALTMKRLEMLPSAWLTLLIHLL